MTYVGLRPMRSDRLDQTKRPIMLASDSTPTKPPAAAAVTELVAVLAEEVLDHRRGLLEDADARR